ncbi:MAG: pyridoxal phosphate-dependent aminotransferase [Clostridia bacterium]|nr:pyridoxal phosphate-dependent aminotransferase [Clostridia bacterium]
MIDFDKLTDRRDSFSYKWDVGDGELPMWVADMDFVTAEPVRRAVMRTAERGIYGYTYIPDDYFRAVADYYKRRHGVTVDTSHLVYSNGAVAAISSMVRRLSKEGDNVLLQAPVYNIFYNSIVNNHRTVLSSDLAYDGEGYSIDFLDLESKLSLEKTTLMILCNPHNPVGRVWSRDELSKIADLCHRHGVKVISDEVHADFVKQGLHYIPFFSVSELAASISATIISASKTFNIAGLQSACVNVSDEGMRYTVWRGINTDEVGEPNAFSMGANIAAYTECDEWVDALCDYVFESRRIAADYINREIAGLHAVRGDATYLLWIDISEVLSDSVEFCKRLRDLTGLFLSDGAEYGECARGFVRMNLATQRSRVYDGLDRLKKGVEAILAEKNLH